MNMMMRFNSCNDNNNKNNHNNSSSSNDTTSRRQQRVISSMSSRNIIHQLLVFAIILIIGRIHAFTSPSLSFVNTRSSFGGRHHNVNNRRHLLLSSSSLLSSTTSPDDVEVTNSENDDIVDDNDDEFPDFNGVFVQKKGGQGEATASQKALKQNLSLGAPPARPRGGHFITKGGIQVTSQIDGIEFNPSGTTKNTSTGMINDLIKKLDSHKGVLLTSSYEYPGRYARWSLGFVDPPIMIVGRDDTCTIKALNSRGIVLLEAILTGMKQLKLDGILSEIKSYKNKKTKDIQQIIVKVIPMSNIGTFNEEDRSKQPSLFSVIRSINDMFAYRTKNHADYGQLGLYGSFGYDLTFQFEPIKLKQNRLKEQRDLVLYLPDKLLVVDQDKRDSWIVTYDFVYNGKSTQGLERVGTKKSFQPYNEENPITIYEERDTPKNVFTQSVEKAKREFAIGNLFEAVLSQTFREKLIDVKKQSPSILFNRLRNRNPAPYGFFINLGDDEYLVGASPEMFVRCEYVQDNDYNSEQDDEELLRVETCPISGTVARGVDALEDAKNVKSLMMNLKEESELTMCTDVDRNDKSRICIPGSVKVIGRRQIEMYSRLIHTVDHVEGYLRNKFDSLDAFLCHTWAVTVTGAPKTWAIQFVEDNEYSPRNWYGGAVGYVGFDGTLNTGLTLRTVRIKDGIAEVRAGATLLYDSNPPAEELETELKASAMIDAIVQTNDDNEKDETEKDKKTSTKQSLVNNKMLVGKGKNLVLIDHEDSFVHTLGNYLRQTGANVITLRSGPSALESIQKMINDGKKPNMVVLSPGPGNPTDFNLSGTIDFLINNKIPSFGVCLGLQGMVEYFGGKLGVLGYPMHGKPSSVTLTSSGKSSSSNDNDNNDDSSTSTSTKKSIFDGLPDTFEVARYHSLHGIDEYLPDCLDVTAKTDDGIVMGIQHKTLPMAAVQFHPESILTSPENGLSILRNALSYLTYDDDDNEVDDNVDTVSPVSTTSSSSSIIDDDDDDDVVEEDDDDDSIFGLFDDDDDDDEFELEQEDEEDDDDDNDDPELFRNDDDDWLTPEDLSQLDGAETNLLDDEEETKEKAEEEEEVNNDDINDAVSTSGAERDVIEQLEKLPVVDLKAMLGHVGLANRGSKKDCIIKLALWQLKSTEVREGILQLDKMTVSELRELKQGLGLKGTATTKGKLLDILTKCLIQES